MISHDCSTFKMVLLFCGYRTVKMAPMFYDYIAICIAAPVLTCSILSCKLAVYGYIRNLCITHYKFLDSSVVTE